MICQKHATFLEANPAISCLNISRTLANIFIIKTERLLNIIETQAVPQFVFDIANFVWPIFSVNGKWSSYVT